MMLTILRCHAEMRVVHGPAASSRGGGIRRESRNVLAPRCFDCVSHDGSPAVVFDRKGYLGDWLRHTVTLG